MSRTKKEDGLEETVEEIVPEERAPISKLDVDFSREDLNKLRDKVNEIIEQI